MDISISNLISKHINNKKISYRKLAELTGTDYAYLCHIAKGTKSPPNNEKFYQLISKALKIPLENISEYKKLRVEQVLKDNPELISKIYEDVMLENNQKNPGGLIVDGDSYQVWLDGKLLDLTSKEFHLISFLYNNPNKIFSREKLLEEIWGYDFYGGSRTVDVHIRRLRGKLEPKYHHKIETVRNLGYKFKK